MYEDIFAPCMTELMDAIESATEDFPKRKGESLNQYLKNEKFNQAIIEELLNIKFGDKIYPYQIEIVLEVLLRLSLYTPKGTLKSIFKRYGFDLVEKRAATAPLIKIMRTKKGKTVTKK